jgi:DNA-binding NtrC family response regulator
MMNRVLLVEDKESVALMLEEALRGDGFEVERAADGTEAIRRLRSGDVYSVVLTDLKLPGADGIEVLREVKRVDAQCPVIVMTAFGTVEGAVEAMRIGAYDFIEKPIDLDRLTLLLHRCQEHRSLFYENLLLKDEFRRRLGVPAIIGESSAISEVSKQVQKVAPTDSTVLLLGESGTGKELFARAVHQLSTRRERPFVAINCAAIPETLLENELFGHEKGAYTGASSRQIGKFELAEGGTIFLDEIGDLPLALQSKILRVLQEKTFERIGGNRTARADVRVVCATNQDLQRAVSDGRFREDLFYRIHVFPITIPPLRARREDIRPLVDYFLERFRREMGRPALKISDAARSVLADYHWPGNVRELENCIERAAILCEGNTIDQRDLIIAPEPGDQGIRENVDFSGSLSDVVERAVQLVERLKIEEVLRQIPNRQRAAERLGVNYRTLLNKIKQYGLAEREENE